METSIYENRAAVQLENGKTVQFVVWDLKESEHEKLKNQINTAFNICGTFEDIITHLKINGFDVSLEDIYEN